MVLSHSALFLPRLWRHCRAIQIDPLATGGGYTVQFRRELCPGWQAKGSKRGSNVCWGRCPNLSCVNQQHLCLEDLTPHQVELFCTSMNNTNFAVFRKLTLQISSSLKYVLCFGLESPIALLAPPLPGCPGLLNFTTFHMALQSSAACIETCRFRGLPHFGD